MIVLGSVLCIAVILWVVVPAWPVSPPKPKPKPKVIGYDKRGRLIYEKPPNRIDFYA